MTIAGSMYQSPIFFGPGINSDKYLTGTSVNLLLMELKSQSEAFSELCKQVNHSLPYPLSVKVITPSEATQKKVSTSALEWKMAPGTRVVTSAQILLSSNLDRRQAIFGIIFETCNASFKEEFSNIRNGQRDGSIDNEETYSRMIEEVEFNSLNLSKKIFKDVDLTILSEVDNRISTKFADFLNIVEESGHRDRYREQFRQNKERY